MGKLAMFFEQIEGSKVNCKLCPHYCVIKPDGVGICRVRKNIDGKLYTLNYGKITSLALDPIEKKPLNRFYPGSYILSAGTFGCNLKCSFCQNWTISQEIRETEDITPEELVDKAKSLMSLGNIGIAYTYNEPSIWYEFVYETSMLAREKGLKNVLVTNGFINRQPLEDIIKYIDAMNIDVKANTEKFYKEICKATLHNVKDTVEFAADKCHVEVTTLVIPGLNDSKEEIGQLSQWLASVSTEIPLHLSRYFPNYKMDIPITSADTLIRAKKEAEKHLRYVYLGNI